MTRAQANHLVEGERVKTGQLAGTVVGATKNCVLVDVIAFTLQNQGS